MLAAVALGGGAPPATYRNPVIDRDFPDPATLRGPDGWTYVYATQGNGANIQVARSRDLSHWEPIGDALPVKPSWAAATQDFWAPHVVTHDGRFFLYFSAKPDAAPTDTTRGLCLAVAVAAQPQGPFTDSGQPLRCGGGFVNIDPFAFDDPASGKRLLYWGSGFGPIRVQELAADRVHFAPGSRPTDLVAPIPTDSPANYRRLVEGAWVVRRAGLYYLFFSGDNCCGAQAHYAVMVARSRHATGPFIVRDAPILHARGRWLAPGHNAVFTDDAGQDWLLYHAVDTTRSRAKPSDGVNTRRVMLMDRLTWRDGWPRVVGDAPSDTPQSAPVLRSPRPARR